LFGLQLEHVLSVEMPLSFLCMPTDNTNINNSNNNLIDKAQYGRKFRGTRVMADR